MLASMQRTVYPEEVTRQLHVMAQARDSLPVIDMYIFHRMVKKRGFGGSLEKIADVINIVCRRADSPGGSTYDEQRTERSECCCWRLSHHRVCG